MEFVSGTINLNPASEYPWPDFMEYISLENSYYVNGYWGGYSNLPDTVYYLNVASMYNLAGLIQWDTLPRNLEKFYLSDTDLHGDYTNLTGMPDSLEYYVAYHSQTLPTATTFDWKNLPSNLKYLDVDEVPFSGTVDLTSLPNDLYYIDIGYCGFDHININNGDDNLVSNNELGMYNYFKSDTFVVFLVVYVLV